jgi:hypothetical protein
MSAVIASRPATQQSAVCNTMGTILPHHMPPEDDEPLTQEPDVLGLYWLLADDDINCSR